MPTDKLTELSGIQLKSWTQGQPVHDHLKSINLYVHLNTYQMEYVGFEWAVFLYLQLYKWCLSVNTRDINAYRHSLSTYVYMRGCFDHNGCAAKYSWLPDIRLYGH